MLLLSTDRPGRIAHSRDADTAVPRGHVPGPTTTPTMSSLTTAPTLQNVRCRFCRRLYARPLTDCAEPKECTANECLQRRRFSATPSTVQEDPAMQIEAIRIAIHDRSQKPINSCYD